MTQCVEMNSKDQLGFICRSLLQVLRFLFCHAHTVCFYLFEQNGVKIARHVLLAWKRKIYLLLCISHFCMLCTVFENNESVTGWKAGSLVAYCESCFWEEWQKKWILRKLMIYEQTRQETVMFLSRELGIMEGKTFRNCLLLFTPNYIWFCLLKNPYK